jgi:mono/diheme cytochrome c family protein
LVLVFFNSPHKNVCFVGGLGGGGGGQLEFLEATIKDPICASTSGEHAPLIAGLARCVGVENDPSRIEQVLALAAERKPGEWQQLAILDGLSALLPETPAARKNARRRTVSFPAEPRAARLLRAVEIPGVTDRVQKLETWWTWPGKPGMEGLDSGVSLSAADQESVRRGRVLYSVVCGPCHQPDGDGQEGLAPPLVDSEWALGSPDRLIRILLHGVKGPLKVRGREYDLDMPALGESLDDTQLADVLTYLRREWGHLESPVLPENVRWVRGATAGRVDAWTESQLLEINTSEKAGSAT